MNIQRRHEIDILDLDEMLSERERLIRDCTRRFVDTKIRPYIEKWYEERHFPAALVPQFVSELQLFGAFSDQYGCQGLSPREYGLMMQEIEAGDSAFRSFSSVHNMDMWAILQYGAEAQKDYWIPKMREGEIIGCFALTEEEGGSDPLGNMKTIAMRTENGFLLNGKKRWITSGSIANVALVWARIRGAGFYWTEEDIKKGKDIRGFLVEKGRDGFRAEDVAKGHGKLSYRASDTSELIFENCEIPEENLLPGTDIGTKSYLLCLNEARFGIVWGVIGAAEDCIQSVINFAESRSTFGKSITNYALVWNEIVEMCLLLQQMKIIAYRLAELKKQGALRHTHISSGKLTNTEYARTIAQNACDIIAANASTGEYSPSRHLANLQSVVTYEGTAHIHRGVLAKHILHIDPNR